MKEDLYLLNEEEVSLILTGLDIIESDAISETNKERIIKLISYFQSKESKDNK